MTPARDEATTLTFPSDREIRLTRMLAAPRALVWKAWTNPEHVGRWWGPNGFTTTTREIDIRPGGGWRHVMHGPDGRDYENLITYLELVEPSRIVYKHGGALDAEPVNFPLEAAGLGGQSTLVTLLMTFVSKSALDLVIREYGADEGGRQHLRRLDEFVEGLDTTSLQAGCA